MATPAFCDILDVCRFLERHFAAPFTAYGMSGEFAMGEAGQPAIQSAPKPGHLFRGQTCEYATLRPTIYRNYPPQATWQETKTLQCEADSLLMPNPHYNAELERDFYFSCVKASEMIRNVKCLYPNFPGNVDGHALCQHYRLRTHCLDFSHDVWVSGFFASHDYSNGAFAPCEEGIGVMYVLDATAVPPGTLNEIGFQPLPRPFAQKGFLLRVTPEVNLLAHPAVWKIFFRHSASAGFQIGERFDQGRQLVPRDNVSEYIQSHISERWITAVGLREYLQRVPDTYRPELNANIRRLFQGQIPILGEA